MKVLLITQLFDPENSIKGLSFVKGLIRLGNDVTVVTTFPSYPVGKIYAGYQMKLFQVDYMDGVRVVRIPSYISHGRGALKRLLGYATFSCLAFFYSLLFSGKQDVIYSYYPPIIGGVAAGVLGVLKRCPFIYDVQDLWPEAVVATGMVCNKKIVGVIEAMAGWIYRRARFVVVLSKGYKEILVSKGVPAEKVYVVYNWCDESRINDCPVNVAEKGSFFDVVYAGNLGRAQALSFVIDSAEILQRQGGNNVRFIFIGEGVEKSMLMNKASMLGLKNVVFKDRVDPEKIRLEFDVAGALLVHLADDPIFSITIPQKTQAYMAAGKPLLMAVKGESASLVAESGAGISVPPCNPVEIASAALKLANSSSDDLELFGYKAKKFYAERMSQDRGVKQISALFNKIVDGS